MARKGAGGQLIGWTTIIIIVERPYHIINIYECRGVGVVINKLPSVHAQRINLCLLSIVSMKVSRS